MKKIGVLLHGCGVFDGTEIQEAVLTLLAIKEAGADYVCFAPDVPQHHVLNHITGAEMPESRNVLIESARIARGAIVSINDINLSELDGLVMPGGFGTAKNITKWAFEGPSGDILKEVKGINISENFPRITWEEAMTKYGNDKPDIRFDMHIQNLKWH